MLRVCDFHRIGHNGVCIHWSRIVIILHRKLGALRACSATVKAMPRRRVTSRLPLQDGVAWALHSRLACCGRCLASLIN